MKYLWFIAAFLYIQDATAQAITVKDVMVSVTADSAATARDQALEQAHGIAFQKLLKENFPEKSGPLPSQDTLMNMVTDFSIDREKTSSRSYTASMTFQFDKAQFQAWLQQGQLALPGSSTQHQANGKPLKMTANYTTHAQWQHIKKTMESFPEVQKITVFALSPQIASMEVVYAGDIGKLQQHLLQQELTLSHEGDTWHISSNALVVR